MTQITRQLWRIRAWRKSSACRHCGSTTSLDGGGPRLATVDHRIPRSRGGRDRHDNFWLLCADCNGRKGSLTVEEFRTLEKRQA